MRHTALGLDCMSADAAALMNGMYDRELEHLSAEARAWLLTLITHNFVNAGGVISTNLTLNNWVNGWARMRESTSSAPGGHYGHYKTAAVAARLPDDHPDHTVVLAEIYAGMATLPLKHGFAPKRWQSCIDAILEKIEKLRIVMLYEADFNFVLKLIWGHRLVRNAEEHGCLGKSNHGSRSSCQTSDAQLEKLLV